MIELSQHVYGSLRTHLSREAIADLFSRKGWSVRKCSWTDYEVCSPTAELVIEADDPILIHGPAADSAAEVTEIAFLLSVEGIEYSLEGYDRAGQKVAALP